MHTVDGHSRSTECFIYIVSYFLIITYSFLLILGTLALFISNDTCIPRIPSAF